MGTRAIIVLSAEDRIADKAAEIVASMTVPYHNHTDKPDAIVTIGMTLEEVRVCLSAEDLRRSDLFSEVDQKLWLAFDMEANDFLDAVRNGTAEFEDDSVTVLQPYTVIHDYCQEHGLKRVWVQNTPGLVSLDAKLTKRLETSGLEIHHAATCNEHEANTYAIRAAWTSRARGDQAAVRDTWAFWECLRGEFEQNGVDLVLLQSSSILMPHRDKAIAQQEGLPTVINMEAMYLDAIRKWIFENPT